MSDLDSLSNNEIRLKYIELGFPNVPVTDSSRRIILKKIKEKLNNPGTKETTGTGGNNRRETINIGKSTVSDEVVNVPKSRRTIAVSNTAIGKDDTVPTAIPISTRRRSVQKETTSESTKATKSSSKTTTPIVIIEDDEDDDLNLVQAAENAEKESNASAPIENIPARRKSRSVSVPKVVGDVISNATAAVKKRAMTPLAEEQREQSVREPAATQQKQLSSSAVHIQSVQTLPPMETPLSFTQPLPKPTFEYLSSSQQQSKQHTTTPSVYSTPSSMRYTVDSGISGSVTTGGFIGTSISTYRPKYTAESILNELSDTDATNDDGCKSPFLSNFARDLERRRSVGRTITATNTYNSPLMRRTGGSGGLNYESAIRGRRSSRQDVSFGQIAVAFSRKYHFKKIFCLLTILCASIFIYIYYYGKN